MGMKGPKALPNAIKALRGRKEEGKKTSRKGMGITRMKDNKPMKRYKKMQPCRIDQKTKCQRKLCLRV